MESIKPFESAQLSEIVNRYSRFVSELRKRLVYVALAFSLSALAGFAFYEQIIKFLIEILTLKGINIVFTSPFQFINLAISCGIVTGVVISLPVITFQVLNFLKPALKTNEYRAVVGFVPFAVLLFLAGFSFGALIMKWQIEIFIDRSVSLGIGNILDISGLLTTVFLTSALMGIGFQFPVLLLLFTRLGLIQHNTLVKKRSWVYLGSFMFALLLPPDSILADILLALPLIALYELTLLIDKYYNFKNRKRAGS